MTGSKQRRRGWCPKCGDPLKKRGGSKVCGKCQHKRTWGEKKTKAKEEKLKKLLGGKK